MSIPFLVALVILITGCFIAAIALRRFIHQSNERTTQIHNVLAVQQIEYAQLQTALEGSRILDSSLDYERTFNELARFLASKVCAGCALFVEEEEQLRQVCASSSDAAVEKILAESVAAVEVGRVMRTGRAEIAGSAAIVPMPARAKIAGILVAVPNQGSAFEKSQLRLFEEIGRRAGIALEHARLYSSAQEASRLKDEFVAIVSHELRTPLTPILGAVYMLRTEPDNPKIVNRALDLIERNAKAQSKIVEDLLDVSRIISGKLRLNMETVDLGFVVQSAIETIRPATEAKNIEMQVDLNPLHGVVYGDADRLQQVVWNLLANSAKFTPSGGKIIVELGETNVCAELRVKDTGIGIGPDFLPHVFDRFRQADSSATRTHGGLGLGLAIVRHLVESHGGTVQADSSGDEKGSTFTVKLPLNSSTLEGRKAHLSN